MEVLAFIFASRIFANKRLAQSLSPSVSSVSGFMPKYLDPVVKADQCALYIVDIGTAANNATDLTRNIRAVFQRIRHTRLKLTIEKCRFGVTQVDFLGGTISSEGVSLQTHRMQSFPNKLKFPKSKNDLRRYLRFVNYYGKFLLRTVEMFNPFYNFLKAEVPMNITSDLKETIG